MVWCRAGLRNEKPFSLHRPFLRATNARKPLKPACTIPCVCALHEHAAHTRRMLDKKFKYTNLIETYTMGGGNFFSRGCKSLTGGGNVPNR